MSFFDQPSIFERKDATTINMAPNKAFRAVEFDDCVFFFLEGEYKLFTIPNEYMERFGHAEIRAARKGVELKSLAHTAFGLVSSKHEFDTVAMRLNWDQHKLQYNTKDAMDHLRTMFAQDPDYAHSWHCNIATAIYDAWGPVETDSPEHKKQLKVGEEAASRFMFNAFGVKTSNDMLDAEA